MKRLFVISLDGVNWNILDPLLSEGKLPHLKKLIDGGQRNIFQTHSFISSGSTWPTINLGKHPGEHGIFYSHRQLKSGTYHIVKKKAQDVPQGAFWQICSDAGIPTVVFDLPKAPSIKSINGLALMSWGEEAPWYSPSYPKDLKKEVHKKIGRHPLQEFYHRKMTTLEEWVELKQKHISALKDRFRVLNYLLDKQSNWQLCVTAIQELHLAGHLFWHTMDKEHPDYEEHLAKATGSILEELMLIVDKELGNLLEKYKGAQVLIISNNGMSRSYYPVNILDVVLQKMGHLEGKKGKQGKVNTAGSNSVQELESILPMGLVSKVKQLVPRDIWNNVTRRIAHSPKYWKKSIAFPVPNDVSGAIRINLKGREPNGIVDPKDYEKVCEQIINQFKKLTYNHTDKPVVERVIWVQKEFNGERVNELPDLLIRWTNVEPIKSLQSEDIGSINVKDDKRSGAHTDKGIFISKQKSELFSDTIINDTSIYPWVLRFFNVNT